MLIINKKRISFIFIVLFISIITFSLNGNKQDSIQTVSLPISNKTIILDAGHRSPDEGDFELKL